MTMVVGGTHRDSKRNVSRRQFVTAVGATGATVGLAGCLYGDDGGEKSGTVQFGFDPVQVRNNGKKIKQLFRDNGLSDEITIEFVKGQQDSTKRRKKYNQLLNAEQSQPDMFLMDCGWTIPFIVRGQLLNLTNELSEDRISTIENDYFQASVNTAKDPSSGEIYGVPLFPDFPTMQYRKDLVTQAGYNPDKEGWATKPMTWKRFAEIARDVQTQTDTEYGFVFQFDTYEGLSCCVFTEFMSSWGGAYFGGRENLFGPVGKRPVTVDKQPVVDALRMVRTFVHGSGDPTSLSGYTGSISPTDVLSWKEQDTLRAMQNDKAVFMRNWPYTIASLGTTDAFGTDFGVMPLPYAVTESEAQAQGTGGSTAALGGWHITVNPNTTNKQAALEVIRVAMKDAFQIGLFDITGWLPPKPKLFGSKQIERQKPGGRYMETLRFAGETAMSRPVTGAWPQESTAIYQEVNASGSQEKPPQTAMNELKNRLQSIENQAASS